MHRRLTHSLFLKRKRIKIITIKCWHFCSISSSIVIECDHINTGFCSKCWKNPFVNFTNIAIRINSRYNTNILSGFFF